MCSLSITNNKLKQTSCLAHESYGNKTPKQGPSTQTLWIPVLQTVNSRRMNILTKEKHINTRLPDLHIQYVYVYIENIWIFLLCICKYKHLYV